MEFVYGGPSRGERIRIHNLGDSQRGTKWITDADVHTAAHLWNDDELYLAEVDMQSGSRGSLVHRRSP